MPTPCAQCDGRRGAVCRLNGRPVCDAPECIGALCVTPDVVFPFYDRSTVGERRALHASVVGLANLPAAADMASEIVTLDGIDARAQSDLLAAAHTVALGVLGPAQYSERHYDDFAAMVVRQAEQTKALRIPFFAAASRPVSTDFIGLTLAAMYAAWLAGQRERVRHHAQRIDLFVTCALGARRVSSM